MKQSILIFLLSVAMAANSQLPDHIYKSNIRSVKLHKANDPYTYPLIRLNSVDDLDLYFDDLDGDIKNYYYTFQLCNADWFNKTLTIFQVRRMFILLWFTIVPSAEDQMS